MSFNFVVAALLGSGLLIAQSGAASDPIPKPAVEEVLRDCRVYPLVAIGEGHRNQQVHDFIVSLVTDPRFPETVDDIVVEFGAAQHQDIIDRYVAGELIPLSDLRRVWRDTVNILVWDAPVYERFFRTIRIVNQHNQKRRLRVLLADPPIDWDQARHDDWERVAAGRDEYAAALIEREVLAKAHRALLIFGSGHVTRDSAYDAPGRKPNLAELIEARHSGSIFLIWAHMPGWKASQIDPRLASWMKPTVARLQGTWLGASAVGPPGTPTHEQLADGFLYLGPTKSLTASIPAQSIYGDVTYLRELLRRDQIEGGFNATELSHLRQKYLKD